MAMACSDVFCSFMSAALTAQLVALLNNPADELTKSTGDTCWRKDSSLNVSESPSGNKWTRLFIHKTLPYGTTRISLHIWAAVWGSWCAPVQSKWWQRSRIENRKHRIMWSARCTDLFLWNDTSTRYSRKSTGVSNFTENASNPPSQHVQYQRALTPEHL